MGQSSLNMSTGDSHRYFNNMTAWIPLSQNDLCRNLVGSDASQLSVTNIYIYIYLDGSSNN